MSGVSWGKGKLWLAGAPPAPVVKRLPHYKRE